MLLQETPSGQGSKGGFGRATSRPKERQHLWGKGTPSQKKRDIILPHMPAVPALSALGRTVSWGWPKQEQSGQTPLSKLCSDWQLCAWASLQASQVLGSPCSPPNSYLRELLVWVHQGTLRVPAVGCSFSRLLSQEPLLSSKWPDLVPAGEDGREGHSGPFRVCLPPSGSSQAESGGRAQEKCEHAMGEEREGDTEAGRGRVHLAPSGSFDEEAEWRETATTPKKNSIFFFFWQESQSLGTCKLYPENFV